MEFNSARTAAGLAGIILGASLMSQTATADTGRGDVLGVCRAEIKASIPHTTRIRTSRYKARTKATFVTFRVSTAEGDPQLVTCTYRKGDAVIEDAEGKLLARKGESEVERRDT